MREETRRGERHDLGSRPPGGERARLLKHSRAFIRHYGIGKGTYVRSMTMSTVTPETMALTQKNHSRSTKKNKQASGMTEALVASFLYRKGEEQTSSLEFDA